MVESFRPTPEHQELHKAIDDKSDTNSREALQKLLAEEIVKQASDAPLLT